MKVPSPLGLTRFLRSADPLPSLALGFGSGLLLAVFLALPPNPSLTLLPFREALEAVLHWELPIFLAIALLGLGRLPILPRLVLLLRSLIWGYGSLRIFVDVGQSFLYFQYVLGGGLTLIPLCCLTKLAVDTAQGTGSLHGPRLYDYLCRCLFYWGLVLSTLPLRLWGG
ncbi:MAG: hypothetical protein J6R82_06140 [Clostridia bacterium]|nr:hypothetical protein [Clostridia bacterium]